MSTFIRLNTDHRIQEIRELFTQFFPNLMMTVYGQGFELMFTFRLWWYLFELFVPIVGGQTPPLDHGEIQGLE